MKKCAVYVRVSTSNGSQDYARQKNELFDIAKKDNYLEKNIELFADTISGYKFEERDNLNILLDKIRENPSHFSCLYVSEISRLGRNPKNTRNLIEELMELKVPIYIQSLNEKTLDKDGKRNFAINIVLQVLLEYADLEANTLKLRSKSGRIQKVKEGKAGGGKYYPYGYKKDEKKFLIVDDDEATVIIKIFNLYMEGYGIRAISHILNAEKIPTRSKKSFPDQIFKYSTPKIGSKVKWSDKQIHDILTNPIYKGQRRFLGSLYESPVIISEEIFDQCNKILKNKTNRNSYKEYTYLLKEILKCGVCGRNYVGRYKIETKGEKVYKCSSTLKRGESCSNFGINIELIETIMFHLILNSKKAIKSITNEEELQIEIRKDIRYIKSKLNSKADDLEKFIKRKKKLFEYILDNDDSDNDLKEMIEKNEKNITESQSQIKDLNNKLLEKQSTLKELTKPNHSKDEFLNRSTDRTKLHLVYKQLISHSIVNYLNKDYILVTTYFKVGFEVLKVPLKLLIDLTEFRKKNKAIKYKALFQMEFEPYYRNGIYEGESEDIMDEFHSSILVDWQIIEKNSFLKMKTGFDLEL
jgi:site-specific DNA recombinase